MSLRGTYKFPTRIEASKQRLNRIEAITKGRRAPTLLNILLILMNPAPY